MFQVRQMLSVSPVLRAAPKSTVHKNQTARGTQGDAWAVARSEELVRRGVPAQVKRFRVCEDLCVVYLGGGNA